MRTNQRPTLTELRRCSEQLQGYLCRDEQRSDLTDFDDACWILVATKSGTDSTFGFVIDQILGAFEVRDGELLRVAVGDLFRLVSPTAPGSRKGSRSGDKPLSLSGLERQSTTGISFGPFC
jgi:hypothetical protein